MASGKIVYPRLRCLIIHLFIHTWHSRYSDDWKTIAMEESENFKPADESSNSKGEEDSRQVQLSIRTSAQQTEFGDSHLARLDREGLYEDPHATNLRGHASQALNAKGTGRTSTPARGPTTPSPEETPDRLTDQYGEVQTVPLAPSSLGEVRSQVLAPPSESDRRHGRPSVNARLQMFVARRCNEMSGRKIFFARFLMRCLRRRMYGKTRNWHLEAQRRSGHRPRDVESLELRRESCLPVVMMIPCLANHES